MRVDYFFERETTREYALTVKMVIDRALAASHFFHTSRYAVAVETTDLDTAVRYSSAFLTMRRQLFPGLTFFLEQAFEKQFDPGHFIVLVFQVNHHTSNFSREEADRFVTYNRDMATGHAQAGMSGFDKRHPIYRTEGKLTIDRFVLTKNLLKVLTTSDAGPFSDMQAHLSENCGYEETPDHRERYKDHMFLPFTPGMPTFRMFMEEVLVYERERDVSLVGYGWDFSPEEEFAELYLVFKNNTDYGDNEPIDLHFETGRVVYCRIDHMDGFRSYKQSNIDDLVAMLIRDASENTGAPGLAESFLLAVEVFTKLAKEKLANNSVGRGYKKPRVQHNSKTPDWDLLLMPKTEQFKVPEITKVFDDFEKAKLSLNTKEEEQITRVVELYDNKDRDVLFFVSRRFEKRMREAMEFRLQECAPPPELEKPKKSKPVIRPYLHPIDDNRYFGEGFAELTHWIKEIGKRGAYVSEVFFIPIESIVGKMRVNTFLVGVGIVKEISTVGGSTDIDRTRLER